MIGKIFIAGYILLIFGGVIFAEEKFEIDAIKTSIGDLEIAFIGHGTLMLKIDGKIIHVDPVSREADYSNMPKADLILVTHEHSDHLDTEVIDQLTKKETLLIMTLKCADRSGKKGIILKNGDMKKVLGFQIEAVPAYNIKHKRKNGNPYHPKGIGNGYVLTFGDTRLYIAGDTENIPEMKNLKNIDIAFLPMNLPYTMTPEMVADAALLFKPRILYPYHFGETDTDELLKLLKDHHEIEIRVRDMK